METPGLTQNVLTNNVSGITLSEETKKMLVAEAAIKDAAQIIKSVAESVAEKYGIDKEFIFTGDFESAEDTFFAIIQAAIEDTITLIKNGSGYKQI